MQNKLLKRRECKTELEWERDSWNAYLLHLPPPERPYFKQIWDPYLININDPTRLMDISIITVGYSVFLPTDICNDAELDNYDLDLQMSEYIYEYQWRGLVPQSENTEDPYNVINSVMQGPLANAAGFTNLSFTLDHLGQPMLIPVAQSNLNLNDPIYRYIDYLQMVYLSTYWRDYEQFFYNSYLVQKEQLRVGLIQVIANVLVNNFVIFAFNPMAFVSDLTSVGTTFSDTLGTGVALGLGNLAFGLGHEIFEELFLEQVFTNVALLCGASNQLANQIGESTGFTWNTLTNIGKVSGNSKLPLDISPYRQVDHELAQNQFQLTDIQSLIRMDARLLQAIDPKLMTPASDKAQSRLALSAITSQLRSYITGQTLTRVIQTFRMNTQLTEGMIQVALGFMSDSEVKNAYLGASFVHTKLEIHKYDTILSEVERREHIETALWTDRHLSLKDFLVKNRELFGVSPDCEQYMVSGIKGVGFMKAQENGQIAFLDLNGKIKYTSKAQPYQLMSIVLQSDSLAMVDPKKTSDSTDNSLIDENNNEETSEEIIFTPEKMGDYFAPEGQTPTTILPSSINYQVALPKEMKQNLLKSTYLLSMQLSHVIKRTSHSANQPNLFAKFKNYDDRFDAIQSNLINLNKRYSDVLELVLAYCMSIDFTFPDFYFDGTSYHLGRSETKHAVQYHSFGKQIYDEFWNLDPLYQDIINERGKSEGVPLIRRIQTNLDNYYHEGVQDPSAYDYHLAREIINYIKQEIGTIFASDSKYYQTWMDIIGYEYAQPGQTFADRTRGPQRLFKMSPKAIAMQEYFQRLSTLYDPITLKNPRDKDLSGYRLLATKINTLFSSYVSQGDIPAVVFSDGTSLFGSFRLREVRDPGLSLAQAKVLDLINQEAFDFFQEFAVDGVEYANAFAEAMCANALGYKVWIENPYQPIAPHKLHWERLQMLDDLLATVDETYWISSNLGRKFPTGKIITPLTSNPRFIRFLNGDELTDAGAFGNLQKISSYNQESFTLSLVPQTKTIDIKGDELMRSLGRTFFKNLALADPNWLSKHGYLRSVTTKGIVPDGLVLFGLLHNTFPTIDTAILFEHLDYVVNALGWYARQKQFDTKTLLEYGIPLISIVNTYAMYNSYLEFPTDLVITKNGLPLRIPSVIGFNNPLLTKPQSLLLGLVFKTPDLTWTTSEFGTRPLVELSFKEILLHLDQIVGQNQALLPSFTQTEARLIQEQFGIQDGILHEALPITRETYLYDINGNPIPNTKALRTYTVRMAAFWQAIDSTGSTTINSLIIGLTYGLCDAQGASLIKRPNLLTHILHREYGDSSLYP